MKYRVDIDVANKTKSGLAKVIDGKDSRVLNKVGAFSSLFALDISKYKEPILVLKTEEPGSKQVLAFKYDKVESVCFDMINHLINDCIVMTHSNFLFSTYVNHQIFQGSRNVSN